MVFLAPAGSRHPVSESIKASDPGTEDVGRMEVEFIVPFKRLKGIPGYPKMDGL